MNASAIISSSQNQASNNPKYLFQSRHGIYYARLVVPPELRASVGKRELRRSLQTRVRKEAVQRSWLVLAQMHELLTSKEAAGSSPLVSDFRPQVHIRLPETHTARRAVQSAEQLPKLSVLIDKFIAEKSLTGAWCAKEKGISEGFLNRLVQVVGDKPIDRFTKKHALKLKEQLVADGLAVSTINKRLTKAVSLFNWIGAHYDIPNVFKGIRLKDTRRTSSLRKAVSKEQVKTLLMSTSTAQKHYQRWLPILAAYTGARLGELCQLYLDDIRQVDGIWCIHIRAGKPDQKIKTANSERIIPVHSRLIEAGFIEYVQRTKTEGQERLFPELSRHHKNGYGATPSKWFARFKKSLGWTQGEDFHSLRHAVATDLKRQGVPVAKVAGLLGHSQGSITFDRYGKDFKPQDLVVSVEAIDWN